MASHTSQPKGDRFQAPPNGKSGWWDSNPQGASLRQILSLLPGPFGYTRIKIRKYRICSPYVYGQAEY